MAVKVTETPAQTGLEDAEILTLTGKFALTFMVIIFDVAGFPVGQIAFDVKIKVMISPFASAASVYVVEEVPTFVPFFFH